jgi:pyruvate dehydrogenase E1 component alpha subunit
VAETGDVSSEELDAIDAEVMALIDQAVDEAKAAPRPTAEEVTHDVYINYA